MKKCRICNCEISSERLEIIPWTDVCAQHSTTRKKVSRMIFSHKTGGEVFSVDADNAEAVRILEREYNRGR